MVTGVVASSGPWTLGVLIGVPVFVIILAAILIFAGLAFREGEDVIGVGAVFASLAVVGLALWAFFPYSSEYHQWRPVSGTVQAVSHRLISTGDKTMSERYVVKIDGQPFGVDDTRAGLLKPGDHVDLACKKEWQYAAESGWACRWR